MATLADWRIDQSRAHAELGEALTFRTDPRSIKKLIKKECFVGNNWLQQKPFFDYFIVGGDWHRDHAWVADDRNFLEMKELLAVRGNFRASESYRKCIEELHNGVPQKGIEGDYFATVADIDEAFAYYLDLIVSMESVGYLPVLTSRKKKKEERHIGICIAPDGEFFHFRTGHHRLAIATLLNLNHVMVQVHCVHSEWAARAVRKYGGAELQAIVQAITNLAKEQKIG
jgi:hypothetical protein